MGGENKREKIKVLIESKCFKVFSKEFEFSTSTAWNWKNFSPETTTSQLLGLRFAHAYARRSTHMLIGAGAARRSGLERNLDTSDSEM